MLNWDELHITIISPEDFLVTEDEKAYSLDAEQRMIVFTGERGLDGDDGKDGKSVNPVGDWNVSNEYKYLDLVYRGGNSYIAKKDVPAGVLVTDTEYWMLSATASEGRITSTYWGEISGSIENQTDLKNAINSLQSDIDEIQDNLGTMSEVDDAPSDGEEYVRKNGNWTVNSGGGVGVWGAISGNIENQTDLKNALDGKASAIVASIPTITSGAYVVVPIDAEIVGYKATYQVSQEGSGTPSASNIRPFIAAESAVQVNATNYESTPAGASIRTIALPSPIYGGVVDLHNGTVTVTHGHIASYNGESISGEWYSDRDVYSENTTPTLGAEVVYKLKKPIHMYCDPMPTSRYYTHIWVVRNSSNVMTTEYTVEVAYYLQNSSEGVVDTKTYVDQMNAEKANSDDLGMMAYADDAPSDNVEYVRKNGDWAVSSGGGGGSGGTPVWGTIIGSLNQQTDLQNALDTKVNAASLGGLASVDDAPSDGSEYVRKNGAWAVSSGGGGGGAGVWGSITGTLSNQTDLQTALDARLRALSIADEFSSTTSYPAGWNYAVYKGILYRFTGPYQGPFEHLTSYEPITVEYLLSLKADTDHNHDSAYAALNHNHDSAYAAAGHDHDDRYYTESETDTLLSGKSDTGHNHDTAYAALGHTHDDRYYTESETNTLLSGKADTGHTHDDRYYTEAETDTLLSGKSDTSHNHDSAYAALNHNHDSAYAALGHTHDDRYYTEAETDDLLDAKQDVLTFDSTPTASSVNPVTSGGVKSYVDGKILYYYQQAVSVATSAQMMRIPASGTSSAITTDTVVLECVFANPARITSDVTWTSYDGYITFSGTCVTATTANVVVGVKGN